MQKKWKSEKINKETKKIYLKQGIKQIINDGIVKSVGSWNSCIDFNGPAS